MGIGRLCADSARIAREHGWGNNLRDQIILINSELSECLEEHRAGRKPGEIWWNLIEKEGSGKSMREVPAGTAGAKPEGVVVELADCLIRIANWCGDNGADLSGEVCRLLGVGAGDPYGSVDPSISMVAERAAGREASGVELPELLRRAVADLVKCDEEAARPDCSKSVVTTWFARIAILISGWCARNGAPLEAAVGLKQAYNESRPWRHGGKAL